MSIGTPVSLGTNTNAAAAASITITTTSAIQANDLVLVAIGTSDNAPTDTVSSVSDGTNTYSRAISQASGDGAQNVELWYKQGASAVGSGATITVTLSGTVSFGISVAAARVSGVDTSSPLDKTGIGPGTSITNPSASTGTLSRTAEIVIGVLSSGSANTTDATFSSLAHLGAAANANLDFCYRIVSTNSTVTYSPTQSPAAREGCVVASFFAPLAISGVQGSGAAGGPVGSVSTGALTGIAGTGAVGSAAANVGGSVTGVFATGAVGTPAGMRVNSVSGTGAVGSLSAAVTISFSGVVGSGAAGSLFGSTSVQPTGVVGSGSANDVFPIPPAPTTRAALLIPAENGIPASLWLGSTNGN